LLVSALPPVAGGTESAVTAPVRVGVLPYLSPKALMTTWAPLVEYLETILNRPAQLVTAPDFATFAARSLADQYDIVLTAPHFAVLIVRKRGYRPLVMFAKELYGDVVVARHAGYRSLSDLKHQIVVMPDRLAIVSALGEQLFRRTGIDVYHDLSIQYVSSHNDAMMAVVQGRAAAAVTAFGLSRHLPASLGSSLRVLASTSRVPHGMALLHPALGEADYRRLKSRLRSTAMSGDLAAHIASLGWGALVEVDAATMARLISRFSRFDGVVPP